MRTDQLVKITQEETERLKKEEVLGELNIGIIEIVTGNPHTPPSTIIGQENGRSEMVGTDKLYLWMLRLVVDANCNDCT